MLRRAVPQLLVPCVVTLALAPLASAQGEPWTTVEFAELHSSSPVDFADFGRRIRLRGSTLLVGSSASHAGHIHVFERAGDAWSESAVLRPASEPSTGACDISGDTIAIGSYTNDAGGFQSGAVHMFERAGGAWSETALLHAPTPRSGDRFGYSLTLQGDTLVVGAPRSIPGEPGRAYVFERTGGVWTLAAELLAPGAVESDEFGFDVAIDGDVLAVAAWEEASERGACYVFRRSGGTWSLEERLIGHDSVANDFFGWAVDVSGDAIAASSIDTDLGTGAVYVFRHGVGGWSEEAKLVHADANIFDHVGRSVALLGDRLVTGTFLDWEGAVGSPSAHLFERSAGAWSHVGRLLPSDPQDLGAYGASVAVGPDVAVVGAYRDSTAARHGGAVYLFDDVAGDVRNVCDALRGTSGVAARLTFNGSTSLSGGDMTLHAVGSPAATFALFVRGAEPANLPLGAGTLCISPFTPGLTRLLPVVRSDAHGTCARALGPADLPPAAVAGDTIYFQCIFREPSIAGSTVQLTDALRITFAP